jgi:hypothetical protein
LTDAQPLGSKLLACCPDETPKTQAGTAAFIWKDGVAASCQQRSAMIATHYLSTPFEAPPCPSALRSGSSGCQNFSANWKTVMSTSPRMIHGRPTANRLCLYVRIATKIPMGASCRRERESRRNISMPVLRMPHQQFCLPFSLSGPMQPCFGHCAACLSGTPFSNA